jgi:hypothetical protein
MLEFSLVFILMYTRKKLSTCSRYTVCRYGIITMKSHIINYDKSKILKISQVPVAHTSWEAEIRKISVYGQPWQIVY